MCATFSASVHARTQQLAQVIGHYHNMTATILLRKWPPCECAYAKGLTPFCIQSVTINFVLIFLFTQTSTSFPCLVSTVLEASARQWTAEHKNIATPPPCSNDLTSTKYIWMYGLYKKATLGSLSPFEVKIIGIKKCWYWSEKFITVCPLQLCRLPEAAFKEMH